MEDLKDKAVLDLGCGSGIIGVELLLQNSFVKHIYFSDLSKEAISICNENLTTFELGNKGSVKQGSLFEPWDDHKFDVIINDVSGISNQVPFFSEWFEDIPCDCGETGIDLFEQMIAKAMFYLEIGGKLITPLISLSHIDKAYKLIEKCNFSRKVLGKHSWVRKIKSDQELFVMEKLKSEGLVRYDAEDGNYVFFTEILELERNTE
jgi:precorrin-6B methylase 2